MFSSYNGRSATKAQNQHNNISNDNFLIYKLGSYEVTKRRSSPERDAVANKNLLGIQRPELGRNLNLQVMTEIQAGPSSAGIFSPKEATERGTRSGCFYNKTKII